MACLYTYESLAFYDSFVCSLSEHGERGDFVVVTPAPSLWLSGTSSSSSTAVTLGLSQSGSG